jgi:hypothetical protein
MQQLKKVECATADVCVDEYEKRQTVEGGGVKKCQVYLSFFWWSQATPPTNGFAAQSVDLVTSSEVVTLTSRYTYSTPSRDEDKTTRQLHRTIRRLDH